MKVLVTGAAGFLGSWIVRSLVATARHDVRVLVRPTSDLRNIASLAIERREGDVRDRASVARALDGCDGLIHAAGVATFEASKAKDVFDVNVGGTENVFGAARDAGVTRAVLTSSVGAMGGSLSERVLDETDASNADELKIPYFVSKLRAERAALARADDRMRVTIVRPSVAIGPGDIYESSTVGFLLPLAKEELPFFVVGGASFADVRDIADGHVAALERGGAGETYILGGHNLDVRALAEAVAKLTGARVPRRMPYAAALAAAIGIERGASLVGAHPPVSADLVRASRLYTYVSSRKAAGALGYAARPFDASLADTFRFFLETSRLAPRTPELEKLAGASAQRG